MIFAAGLGTRLRPLTDNKPKALVEINGKALLEIAIRKLMDAGCREIIINVHHFAEMIVEFLVQKKHFGIHIEISDERERLLDTGGGLKKAAWFFEKDSSFLVCNADILTSLDLEKFYHHHLSSGALATLAVRQRSTSRYFLLDENMRLKGWENARTGETRWCGDTPLPDMPLKTRQYAFSGIHAIRPAIFEWMPEEDVFSIIDIYVKAAASCLITGYPHNQDFWLDVGKPESLEKAAQILRLIEKN